MANRKQRHTRADVQRIHTQTEINRRLHRAHNLAFFLRIEMLAQPCDNRLLWLPSVLDYIADDIGDIKKLLNQPAHTA
ncbi:derepression protein [Salmonella enterica]|nr:derepression protein [Salmonella enterica]